jgi:hypothetical protein
VPTKRFTVNGLTFDAPVAIREVMVEKMKVCVPVEDNHGYVYAMPGGGRIDSRGVVLLWSQELTGGKAVQ